MQNFRYFFTPLISGFFVILLWSYSVHPAAAGAPFQEYIEINSRALTFIREAAVNCELTLRLSQIAEAKAKSPLVKEYAGFVIAAHSRMKDGLADAVKNINVDLPDDLPQNANRLVADMTLQPDKNFDRQFIYQMIQLYQHEVQKYEEAKDFVSAGELRKWLVTSLAEMWKLFDQAKAVRRNL